MIPRKLSIVGEETDIGDILDIAITCVDIFRKNFPHKTICRVGHVNDYVFTLGTEPSVSFLAERFTRMTVPQNGELNIRVNMPTDDYNRVIQLQPVVKKQPMSNIPEAEDVKAYGLSVSIDFNNSDMTKSLDNDDIRESYRTR